MACHSLLDGIDQNSSYDVFHISLVLHLAMIRKKEILNVYNSIPDVSYTYISIYNAMFSLYSK